MIVDDYPQSLLLHIIAGSLKLGMRCTTEPTYLSNIEVSNIASISFFVAASS